MLCNLVVIIILLQFYIIAKLINRENIEEQVSEFLIKI